MKTETEWADLQNTELIFFSIRTLIRFFTLLHWFSSHKLKHLGFFFHKKTNTRHNKETDMQHFNLVYLLRQLGQIIIIIINENHCWAGTSLIKTLNISQAALIAFFFFFSGMLYWLYLFEFIDKCNKARCSLHFYLPCICGYHIQSSITICSITCNA